MFSIPNLDLSDKKTTLSTDQMEAAVQQFMQEDDGMKRACVATRTSGVVTHIFPTNMVTWSSSSCRPIPVLGQNGGLASKRCEFHHAFRME